MEDIHDIKPVITMDVLESWQIVFFWVFSLFLFLIFLYFFYKKFIYKYFQQKDVIISPPVETVQSLFDINYIQSVLDHLKNLENKISELEDKSFSLTITKILKEYFSRKYNLSLQEMTSSEFLLHCQSPEKEILAQIFQEIDQCKFASKNLKNSYLKKILNLSMEFMKKDLRSL